MPGVRRRLPAARDLHQRRCHLLLCLALAPLLLLGRAGRVPQQHAAPPVEQRLAGAAAAAAAVQGPLLPLVLLPLRGLLRALPLGPLVPGGRARVLLPALLPQLRWRLLLLEQRRLRLLGRLLPRVAALRQPPPQARKRRPLGLLLPLLPLLLLRRRRRRCFGLGLGDGRGGLLRNGRCCYRLVVLRLLLPRLGLWPRRRALGRQHRRLGIGQRHRRALLGPVRTRRLLLLLLLRLPMLAPLLGPHVALRRRRRPLAVQQPRLLPGARLPLALAQHRHHKR